MSMMREEYIVWSGLRWIETSFGGQIWAQPVRVNATKSLHTGLLARKFFTSIYCTFSVT